MEYFFDTREEASRAAAERISNALTRRMDGNGAASLVVSGGTTPAATFAELAATPLEWSRVHVVMSDERWVPSDHEDSNEKLVRDTLLIDKAANATLLPVYSEDVQPDERSEQLQEELKHIPFPFACSLLGMGEDGHFASLFPDAAARLIASISCKVRNPSRPLTSGVASPRMTSEKCASCRVNGSAGSAFRSSDAMGSHQPRGPS